MFNICCAAPSSVAVSDRNDVKNEQFPIGSLISLVKKRFKSANSHCDNLCFEILK